MITNGETMSKKDILNNGLWETYSGEVQRRMTNPTFRGEITQEEADKMNAKLVVADWGAESCGDAVRLYWAIDPRTDRVLAARFRSFGCGTAIASTDMMAEMTIGKTVDEVLKITNIEVEHALRSDKNTPAVPPQKMHCSVMAYDVIKKAVSLYKDVPLDSLEEETIVCECAQVSLAMVEDAIRINNLTTVEQIIQYTKAGGYCKSCIKPGGHEKREHYLVDILDRELAARKKTAMDAAPADFGSLSMVRKLKRLETIMKEKISPMLAADGGGLEIVDLEQKDEEIIVFIRYGGACLNCPSSRTGTLGLIQSTLAEETGVGVRVVPL